MTINVTFMAQNSDIDYVSQAYACAMSLKHTNPDSKICIITNDLVTDKQKKVFDHVVPIPWGDMANSVIWKIQNRWKTYHVVPFEETIVMDTDMLVLDSLEPIWKQLQKYNVYYTTAVSTYRNSVVNDIYYRKTFIKNNLPNVYSGFHYFKKNDWSKKFYEYLEIVVKNWELFYAKFAKGIDSQKFLSMDLCVAITIKILECEKLVTSSSGVPMFTHMKSNVQGWRNQTTENWMLTVGSYLTDDLDLYIGNYKQHGIFHYTVDDFMTNDIIKIYEKNLGIV